MKQELAWAASIEKKQANAGENDHRENQPIKLRKIPQRQHLI
jgi:hypothetical protein